MMRNKTWSAMYGQIITHQKRRWKFLWKKFWDTVLLLKTLRDKNFHGLGKRDVLLPEETSTQVQNHSLN